MEIKNHQSENSLDNQMWLHFPGTLLMRILFEEFNFFFLVLSYSSMRTNPQAAGSPRVCVQVHIN